MALTISARQLLKGVDAKTFTKGLTGELNNTTKSTVVNANNSGSRAFQVNDVVAAFNQNSYATPDLDPAARLGVVTARSNTKVTVTWGVLGTPITAISGVPTLGFAQRGPVRVGLGLGVDETAGDASVQVTANKTLAAVDSGVVQRVGLDGAVITLPSVAPGLTYIFVNDSAAIGAVGFSVSPAAADLIQGGGLASPVANKDLINTKATANPGDTLIITGGAATTWDVVKSSGVWAREA